MCLPKSKMLKIHWQHDGKQSLPDIQHDLLIISIDPGVKNYGFRVEKRHANGEVVTKYMDRIDFPSNNNRYRQLTDFLDSKIEYTKKCHIILVEGQYWRSANACRISQHTITYFMMLTRNKYMRPLIIEVNSRLKTSVLSSTKQKNRKKWAVRCATELLEKRQDNRGLSILDKCKPKNDDVADTIVQAEAVVIKLNLNKFITRAPVEFVII